MQSLNFVRSAFFGVSDYQELVRGINIAVQALPNTDGLFVGDNLMTFGKNLSFLTDRPFMESIAKNATTHVEQSAIWRYATLVWAARRGIQLDGDFVECACYKGTGARIVCDAVKFGDEADRRYYLYDLFEHDGSMSHHAMPDHDENLVQQVKQRFADLPNVIVTQGRVPDSFAQALPEKVAFLHIDMNSAEAEIGAIEVLFDRLVPGATVILDDYGWLAYRPQMVAENRWFRERGYFILELPTGQGLVIK